jgi:hypothetical protein
VENKKEIDNRRGGIGLLVHDTKIKFIKECAGDKIP